MERRDVDGAVDMAPWEWEHELHDWAADSTRVPVDYPAAG